MLEIPVELQVIIIGFLTMILTQGLKALANLVGKDFSGWASALVAVVVAASVLFIQGLVGMVPPEYYDVAASIFAVILASLSAFGIHYTRKNVSRKNA